MAQLAAEALHISTLGAVKQFNNLSSSCSPVPVTVIFKIHPYLSNAYWNVISPILSLKNSLRTRISIKYPYLPILFIFLQSEYCFLFTNAVKLNFLPSKKSQIGLLAKKDAIMLPALLPAIIFGIQSAQMSVCTTPIWYIPRIAPPLNNKALLPVACLISPKN